MYLLLQRAPISRHYVYCALEESLYHCRNALPSALDDFDAVCEQHAQEMDTIRPALVAKFEAVPVIEMYKQATIRCAKAKRWPDARQWAERGIARDGQEKSRRFQRLSEWARLDSNQGPTDYESAALTN